jgi:Holliday junction resolvasome RuvABC endonuclease subunit
LIDCHITGASATDDGTDFPSKKRPEASFTAEKHTPYSNRLTAQFQGNLMHIFVTKNSVAVASDYTSALIKKAIVGAAGQNQVYDVLRRSMCTHREKLSSLDTTGFSVAISLQ